MPLTDRWRLRVIRDLADNALRRLSPQLEKQDSKLGRHSIPPERLLRAFLLQCLYTFAARQK